MVTREFVAAGNAIFTVECPAGAPKAHYTFKVRRKDATERWPEAYFVSLLTGPDNTESYTYLGMLNPTCGEVVLTRKSPYGPETYVVRLLRRVLARVWADEAAAVEAAGFRLHHEGRCGRCGRHLTVPESIENGIGPECAQIMAGAAA